MRNQYKTDRKKRTMQLKVRIEIHTLYTGRLSGVMEIKMFGSGGDVVGRGRGGGRGRSLSPTHSRALCI